MNVAQAHGNILIHILENELIQGGLKIVEYFAFLGVAQYALEPGYSYFAHTLGNGLHTVQAHGRIEHHVAGTAFHSMFLVALHSLPDDGARFFHARIVGGHLHVLLGTVVLVGDTVIDEFCLTCKGQHLLYLSGVQHLFYVIERKSP